MTDLKKARGLAYGMANDSVAFEHLGDKRPLLGSCLRIFGDAANTIRDLADEVEQLRKGVHFGEPYDLPEKQDLGLEPCSFVAVYAPVLSDSAREFIVKEIEESVKGPGIDIECKDGGTIHVVGAEWLDDKKEVIVTPMKKGSDHDQT